MYRAVSDETKYHMERVLRTWQELFPRSVISSLEQLVRDHHASFRRDGGTSTRRHPATTTGALTAQQQQQQQRAAADQALQRRVLDELMALIDYKQRLVILNPQDANVARETNALVQVDHDVLLGCTCSRFSIRISLTQLRKLVASGALDATKMQQIGQQIAAMWPRDLPRPNQRQNMTPAQQQPQRQEQLQTPSAVPSNLSDILMQLRDISPLPATSHTRLPMISLLPQDIEA